MNRNEIIGTFIGKTLGYAVQGVAYAKIAEVDINLLNGIDAISK